MEPSGPLIAHIFTPLFPFSLCDNGDLILFPKKKKMMTPAVKFYLYRGGSPSKLPSHAGLAGGRKVPPFTANIH